MVIRKNKYLTDIKCTNIISIKGGIQCAKNEELAQSRMAGKIGRTENYQFRKIPKRTKKENSQAAKKNKNHKGKIPSQKGKFPSIKMIKI